MTSQVLRRLPEAQLGTHSRSPRAEEPGRALRSPGTLQSTQGSGGVTRLPVLVLSPGNQRKYIVPTSQPLEC